MANKTFQRYAAMKIPLKLKCSECGEDNTIFVDLKESSVSTTGSCGHHIWGALGSGITIEKRLLYRSNYELLDQKDFNLSIVFSAMAFECELSYLHNKWERLSAYFEKQPYLSDEELEEMLRKYANIGKKIDYVSELMHSDGLDDFVNTDEVFRRSVTEGFPNLNIGNLAKDFQENLFWPRNRILHLGDTKYDRKDAVGCFNISTLGIAIFDKMNVIKSTETELKLHTKA